MEQKGHGASQSQTQARVISPAWLCLEASFLKSTRPHVPRCGSSVLCRRLNPGGGVSPGGVPLLCRGENPGNGGSRVFT